MRKILCFNNHYKLLRFTILVFIVFSINTVSNAQCDCELITTGQADECYQEQTLSYPHGTNITDALKQAVLNNCRVIIANTYYISPASGSLGNVTFYVSPTVFTNIQDKEIILEQGVTLQGVQGGFSDCSQSVFTFDGNDVRNIIIRGEYDECELGDQPTISAGKPNYENIPEQGFLVAADSDGEPYLNDNGDPNYVYDDNDTNPYYDDNGNPNLIVNNNFPQVEADCDYNDYLCNRDIIVWCPFSLEGRHLIALHGVDNFRIDSIRLHKSAGGDGVHITDDRDFTPAQVVEVKNGEFYKNARTGVVFANAICSGVDSTLFLENGKYISSTLVDTRGAVAFHQNSNIGSTTAYNGKIPLRGMSNNRVFASQFEYNADNEISFDLPLPINYCNAIKLIIKNNCVPFSDDVLAFNNLSNDQSGNIRFKNFTVSDFTNSFISVGVDWDNTGVAEGFVNVSSNTTTTPQNAYVVNNQSFCQNLTVIDWCQTNFTDQLCGNTFTCTTPQDNYSCIDGGTCCELSTNLQTTIEETCECDFLFLVDESGSVTSSEWQNMECTIFNTMTGLDSICTDTTQCFISEEEGYDQECLDSINGLVRFAVVGWSGGTQQITYSDFDSFPYHFPRTFSHGTNLYRALSYVNNEIEFGGLNPKTRIGGLDSTKCLKTLIFTDAGCGAYNIWAQAYANQLASASLSTIDIVDYSGGLLDDCDGAVNVAVGGEIFNASFDCEDPGIDPEDFTDSDTTHVITLDLDQCYNPLVEWTVSNGGEILESNADSTQITVSNTGLYDVVVTCESGCVNVMEESFDIDALEINNFGGRVETVSTRGYVNRDVLIDGQWYSPAESELYKLGLLNIDENLDLNVYPNPSSNMITFDNPYGANSGTYDIFDLQGRRVQSGKFGTNTSKVSSEISGISSGVLILKVTRDSDGFESVTKFIKQD